MQFYVIMNIECLHCQMMVSEIPSQDTDIQELKSFSSEHMANKNDGWRMCWLKIGMLSATNTRFSFIFTCNLHVRFHSTRSPFFIFKGTWNISPVPVDRCMCASVQACVSIFRKIILREKERWNKVAFICCSQQMIPFTLFHFIEWEAPE